MKKILTIIFISIFSVIAFAKPIESFDSKPTSRVMDYTDTLSGHQRESLNSKLESMKSNNKIIEGFIVMVDSTDGKQINDYTNELFRKWQLGNEKLNNGLLVVIAKDDRKYRTEVGYGLEGVLNDGYLGTIMRETFVPNFKKNDYYEGINEYLNSINKKLNNESSNLKANAVESKENNLEFMLILFGLIIGGGLITVIVRRRNRINEENTQREIDEELKAMRRERDIAIQKNRDIIAKSLATGAVFSALSDDSRGTSKKISTENRQRAVNNEDNSTSYTSSWSSSDSDNSSSSSSSSSYDSGGSSGGGGASGDW